jgi:hypothetical protein
VRSTDEGETWEPISGLGKADYHEIEVTGNRILALRNEDPGKVQVSDDGGKTWTSREAPSAAAPIDVAVNPANAANWAVSTDQGTWLSTNEGRTWRQRETTFGARITWGAPDALFSAGKDGTVKRSRDAGKTFEDVGSIGAGPKELIVSAKGELYASVTGGEIRRSTDGGATWSRVISLGSSTQSTGSGTRRCWPPARSPARTATRRSAPARTRSRRATSWRVPTAGTPASSATSCRSRRRRDRRTSRSGSGVRRRERERERLG